MTRKEAIAKADEEAERHGAEPEYFAIPMEILRSIQRYGHAGVPPGGFVSACICNDLKGAIGAADAECAGRLNEIVQYIIWELRAPWGDFQTCQGWINQKLEQMPLETETSSVSPPVA